ncbi:hypothetical protein LX87_05518 [Larkinella arboricola]|uniref:Uncharacterized protein n=1 Tax=Larkinella arboricola TaxID=643671 RepID=A0A327WFL5_LARAB|nr:hypothetical protein [Larkinella arboricola]RAJ90089.1 hypothetical protein LX87_05518 [Larkinella arboricola]
MKKYICLNHGECSWADEKPPREFTLDNPDELNCPNCESKNIKEAPKSSTPPWSKFAIITGLLLLIGGIAWYFWTVNPPPPPPPLKVSVVGLDCNTGFLTLTTNNGDGSPITFGAEGQVLAQKDSSFKIDKSLLYNKSITVFAVQNGYRSTAEFITSCTPLPLPPPPPPGPNHRKKPILTNGSPKGNLTVIEGSEGCEICTRYYSAIDEAGHTHEIREKNSTDCCPCGQTVQIKGLTYRMECNELAGNKLIIVQ